MGTLLETMTVVPAAGTEAILAEMLADVMHASGCRSMATSSMIWVPTRW